MYRKMTSDIQKHEDSPGKRFIHANKSAPNDKKRKTWESARPSKTINDHRARKSDPERSDSRDNP